MPDDSKDDEMRRLLFTEGALVFQIDGGEALRIEADGTFFVYGKYVTTNGYVASRLRHAIVNGAQEFEIKPSDFHGREDDETDPGQDPKSN